MHQNKEPWEEIIFIFNWAYNVPPFPYQDGPKRKEQQREIFFGKWGDPFLSDDLKGAWEVTVKAKRQHHEVSPFLFLKKKWADFCLSRLLPLLMQ